MQLQREQLLQERSRLALEHSSLALEHSSYDEQRCGPSDVQTTLDGLSHSMAQARSSLELELVRKQELLRSMALLRSSSPS